VNFKLKLAFRDNKTATRPYVLVNPILAKHLPVSPRMALDCFSRLGSQIAAVCKGERVLVIGFAETATAVGAAVASAIKDAVYVHTTREDYSANKTSNFPQEQYGLVADFFEEHSHAKNQSLYLGYEYMELSAYDRIIFVEDEITTGKTILNFLQNIEYNGQIIVSALVFNGFDESVFAGYNSEFFCLQKIGYVHHLEFYGLSNPRLGLSIEKYQNECLGIALQIVAAISEADIQNRDVLVVGTEEFMFPALIIGRELEKLANSVKTQSTTRSPLLPQNNDGYPLYSRCEFSSGYDNTRTTFLYNLEKYDTVIIATDAFDLKYDELIHTIQAQGNQTIYYVRIKNAY